MLPNDPPDGNDNNPTPASPASPRGEPSGGPPSFGSNFNPQNNPQGPNNPYPPDLVDPAQSEVAKNQQRDEHGRFTPTEHLKNNNQSTQTTPNQSAPATSSNLPSPITITENTKYSEKKDPPLFNISVIFTNPVTYFKKWVGKFLKNQDIDMRLKIKPFATIGLVLAFSVVGGTAFSICVPTPACFAQASL